MNRSPLRWRSIHGRCGRSERDPDKAWPATAAQRCAHRHPRVRQRRCPALVTRWLSGSRFSEMTGVPPAGSRLVEARERRLSAPSGQPPTPGIRARSASTPSAAVASFRARSQCAESRLRERARRDGLPGETVVHWPQRTPCVATSFSPIHTAFGGLSPGPEPDGVACCHSVRATAPTREAMPSRRSAALAGGSARGATSAEVHRPAGVLGRASFRTRWTRVVTRPSLDPLV